MAPAAGWFDATTITWGLLVPARGNMRQVGEISSPPKPFLAGMPGAGQGCAWTAVQKCSGFHAQHEGDFFLALIEGQEGPGGKRPGGGQVPQVKSGVALAPAVAFAKRTGHGD